MSKLSDYSKFDHLDEDSGDEEHHEEGRGRVPAPSAPESLKAGSNAVALHQRLDSQSNRFVFSYHGTPIYEWEQSLSEVVLYVPEPPMRGTVLCKITPAHIQLGLKGMSRLFLDAPTFAAVETAESTWCWEDDDDGKKWIVIYLQKAAKGVVWETPLTGQFSASIDPVSMDFVKRQLLKERWQDENPGMDFRDAEFNGSIPDPRTYMGGVSYD
jgi:CS domain